MDGREEEEHSLQVMQGFEFYDWAQNHCFLPLENAKDTYQKICEAGKEIALSRTNLTFDESHTHAISSICGAVLNGNLELNNTRTSTRTGSRARAHKQAHAHINKHMRTCTHAHKHVALLIFVKL